MRPALALLLLLASAPVLAQEPAASGSESKDKETKKKKVIRLDAITVEGRIQKPQAFYVLPRGNLSFDELNKAESFVPKVVKSVEKEPF
ncbi:hypothetical protein [Archangium lipolyticum]|uniref:hypothetical protein n=1 Tax=Archangium lipolyticum TaxID=2970465 RepID=UPI00214A6C44|nr:hypothetical protein [Archangium lipolyticum]